MGRVRKGGAVKKAAGGASFRRPVAGILLAGISMLALLGLSTYRPRVPTANLAGPLGHGLANALLEGAGVGAYAGALFVLLVACALIAGRPRLSFARASSWLLFSLAVIALVDLLVPGRVQGHASGGLLGAALAGVARGALSTVGACVLLSAIAAAALVVATDLWALRAAASAGRLGLAGGSLALRGAAFAFAKVREGGEDQAGFDEDGDEPFALAGDDARIELPEGPKIEEPARRKKAKITQEIAPAGFAPLPLSLDQEAPQDPRLPLEATRQEPLAEARVEAKKGRKKDAPPATDLEQANAIKLLKTAASAASADLAAAANPAAVTSAAALASSSGKLSAHQVVSVADGSDIPEPPARLARPTIIEPKASPRPAIQLPLTTAAPAPTASSELTGGFTMHGGRKGFTPPPITILTGEVSEVGPLDRDGLTATAEKLRLKLESFGIAGQVTQIRPGPVVTMFEFLPGAGIKVSRIASLSDDLAMAMEATRVRIVAPIPGKGVVGIEVPNKVRQTVVLKELVEQEAFQKSVSKLAMCLGKDIEGQPYIADLQKMPHLLIAGTTGSGKSVAVNAMIISMLLRASPEDVRFLMVDPKMLELSVYEGIPHLLLPVVTDSKKAAMALRWAVEEMERRYQLLADCGVRNIASYNKKVEKDGELFSRKPAKPPKEKRVIDLSDPALDAHELARASASGGLLREEKDNPAVQLLRRNEQSAESGAEWLQKEMQAQGQPIDLPGKQEALPVEPLKKLPYLVIIIDELADLMMVASREVETYIARLAQMARAAGIHLMVATQRPSTDVVTGVIKANFPARISFQVASRHDSATIINTPGAENLLGMGDMLILPPGTSTLTRVHGPYVDEKEIHAVVEHWKAQGTPVYDPNILRPRAEDSDGDGGVEDQGPDELYDQAVASIADMRFISISLLQRKLRVGYNRAARMIERMERDGMVGAADGAKPREVLLRPLGEMPGAGA